MNLNNVVIKSESNIHAKKIIQFFKSKGIDTRNLKGTHIALTVYYGLIEGRFECIGLTRFNHLSSTLKVIPLPREKSTYPREMYVSDDKQNWCKAKVEDKVESLNKPYLVERTVQGDSYNTYKYAKTVKEYNIELKKKESQAKRDEVFKETEEIGELLINQRIRPVLQELVNLYKKNGFSRTVKCNITVTKK